MIYKNAELHNVECLLPFCRDLLKYQQTDGEYPLPQQAHEGMLMSRVPDEVRKNMRTFAQTTAFQGTGTEIRFNINSGEARIQLARCSTYIERFSIAEVYFGCFQGILNQSPHVVVSGEVTEIVIKMPDNIDTLVALTEKHQLPFDARLVRVVLPYDLPNILFDIEGDIAPPRPEQVPKIKYFAYGSSITHGSVAVRPTGTYASRIAQNFQWDLYNKAFPASAHMDEALGDYLACQKWDVMTLELGVNVVIGWELDEFEEKMGKFVDKIVTANPEKWIFITDMMPFMMDVENNPKTDAFRRAVAKKAESIQSDKVAYITGPKLLKSINGLSTDILHPSCLGAEEIASNFIEFIKAKIGKGETL